MKKALALVLVVLMLCSTVLTLVSAQETAAFNLKDFYESTGTDVTYVGKALSANDAKPVLDGVINEGEYQVEYVVAADGTKDVARAGVPAVLLADYKEYVAHDEEWIYVAFDFVNGSTGLRGRFYWNLSFINSYDFDYNGGSTVNAAFTQNGYGIADGWNFGAEVKADVTEGYSERNNAVTRGTAPVLNTDYFVAVGKEDITEPQDSEGASKTHQVYEIKVSKAWYAAQVGITADEVVDLAWVTLGQEINLYASSYTQIGHYISDAELAVLEETYGAAYTRPTSSSHPYDNAMLPRAIVLDEEPVEPDPYKDLLHELGLNAYVGKAMEVAPVVDGVVNDGEYSYSKTWAPEEIYSYGTEIQSGVDEYIAHDADYIYYAVVFTQESDNRALQWQFQPTNTFAVFNSKDDLRTTLFQRITWQLRYQTDGTTTLAQAPTWNYAIEDAAPQVGEGLDIEYAATKTAENVKTYEIKLAKAYIAGFSGCDVEDVKVLPYFTYFHSACALGHNYTTEETEAIKALGATRADTGLLYRFIVLDEAPPVSINVETMPGYEPLYVNEPIAVAPVQDGVINEGEYTISRELKPYTANKGEVDLEAYTNVTTEYVAYDAEYIYYAYTNAMQYSAGAQLKLRLVHDYIIGDTLTTFPAHRQIEDPEAIQLTLGTGTSNSASEIPEGKAAPTADEFVTYLTHGGSSYTPAVVEMKISRAYLAAQMGLDSASDVTKFTYSTYGTDTVFAEGADWTYLHLDHLLTADQITWLVNKGVKTPFGASTSGDQVSRLFNMIVLAGGEPELPPVTEAPTTEAPTTEAPTTEAPTTEAPTTEAPTTEAPTTVAPTTAAPVTEAPTTEESTTVAPTTAKATTAAATTVAETEAEAKGCKGSIAISALVLLPTLAGGALLAKRRKED